MGDSEPLIRLGIFAGSFVMFAVLEAVFPRRQRHYPKGRRWLANLGIGVVNTVVMRLVFPLAGVGVALLAVERNWGLFNQLALSPWVSVPVFILVFDVVIYWQHRLFHKVPVFWRLHRMHHTDPDFDVTTGNRFHPLEIVLSACIKAALILLLGPPAVAVLVSEVILNSSSLFNHSNLNLPGWLDRALRTVIVTPDMHRIHHSVIRKEHDSNFGFNLSLWDRLFGSYRQAPEKGQQEMEIGIQGFQDVDSFRIGRMLLQPARKNSD